MAAALQVGGVAMHEAAGELIVAEYDVDWLVASKLYPVDLRGLQQLAARSDLLTRRFGNANYVVYEVTG